MEALPQATQKDLIPNEDHVFRNVTSSNIKKKWQSSRVPDESEFVLSERSKDGLSVNWDRHCTLEQIYINLGLTKNRLGEFMEPKGFKIIKFNVGDLRSIKIKDSSDVVDVEHNPIEGNYAHSLVCYDDDVEIRLKLCDLVSKLDPTVQAFNFDLIKEKLEKLREEAA